MTEITELAEKLLRRVQTLSERKTTGDSETQVRWLVGIAGVPSSGKSTLTKLLTNEMNKVISQRYLREFASVRWIGMDGFHYSRKQLDELFAANRAFAHRMRGAHWTFDSEAFGALLRRIKFDSGKVPFPTFDHSKKDPVLDATLNLIPATVGSSIEVVVVEGNYLFVRPKWKAIDDLFDVRILLECDWHLAETRIVERHVRTGVAENRESAMQRWLDNDKPNGEFMLQNTAHSRMDFILEALSNGVVIKKQKLSMSAKLGNRKTQLFFVLALFGTFLAILWHFLKTYYNLIVF